MRFVRNGALTVGGKGRVTYGEICSGGFWRVRYDPVTFVLFVSVSLANPFEGSRIP
jgi:hypothetical protein